jgi:hypothetical protein
LIGTAPAGRFALNGLHGTNQLLAAISQMPIERLLEITKSRRFTLMEHRYHLKT